MTIPFYLLVGFSLETVLKAAYVQLGGDMKVAKREIGHDLAKALACANGQGFQPANEQLQWLVETMADVHRDHSLRYLTGDGELQVADEACSLKIVDDLIVGVDQLLYPGHGPEFWLERLNKFEV